MPVDNLTDSPYIFWLFDCSPTPIAIQLRITPRYVRCDISQTGITLYESPKSISIPFESLKECEMYQLRGTENATGTNIRIKFISPNADDRTSEQTTELFLLPANVLKHYQDDDDRKTMFMLIQALRSGQIVPPVEKNPYHRRLLRQGRTDRIQSQIWDPTLPPSHYSTPPTLGRLLLRLLIVVPTVSIIGMLIIALIYYLMTEVF